jgi:hypothetical protein
MTAVLRGVPVPAVLRSAWTAWLAAMLLGVAVVVRSVESRGALVYPDGYQYLLMARGIGEHLRPMTQLGPHGELFVPNADAALKPLFPALVALLHLAGVSWTGAARGLSAASGAGAVVLTGLVAGRLTGSRLLGAFAALVALLDPIERYWAAFSSPDALGQALALGAVLATLSHRPRTAGLLAGLTLFARPELGLLLLAGGVVLMLRAPVRDRALGFLTAFLFTAAAVLALLRPPLQLVPSEVALACGGALGAAAVALLAPPTAGVAVGLGALTLAASRGTAIGQLAVHDPAVVLLFVLALVAARSCRAASVVAVAAGALALAFELRNGGSSRYMAELVPLAAIGAAVGLRRAAASVLPIAAATAAVAGLVALAATSPAPAPGPDMFGAVARGIPDTGRPIATSAADAYGFLLAPRSIRSLGTDSRGLLLVDATTRAYEPWIVVRGRVVARIPAGNGFLDPSGRLDLAPAVLVDGAARGNGT